MEDVFRFRFQVYCEEKRFLPRDAFPGGLETDEFDGRATHFVVNGDDRFPRGYMRIVETAEQAALPIFVHGLTAGAGFPIPAPGGAVEISRMMVRSDFRKRLRAVDDGFPPSGFLADPPARNASDLIQLKLIRLAYRHALAIDVRWFFAAIEPSQGRKLNMMGFPIRPIGPVGDYFGNVRPHAVDLREMEDALSSRCPKVMDFFNDPAEDIHARVIRPGEWAMPLLSAA
ncbi:PEP-CTERM/exosortase system-associated acyltransferase [Rhizobium laguerreae]|nr:PEP-CTERM/exosortase system-associated acyltransferase [Rhizobium laguerreae]